MPGSPGARVVADAGVTASLPMPTSVGLTKPSAGIEMEIGISTVSRPREARLSSSEQEVTKAAAKTIAIVIKMFFKSVVIISK